MKLLVRLYRDVSPALNPGNVPGDWPAEVQEVDDDTPDPGDGRVFFGNEEALNAYKATKQSLYNEWLAVLGLSPAKEDKFAAIDSKTVSLIAAGFLYGGKQFSLSTSAQSTLNGMYSLREDPAFVYPIKFNTLDDASSIELANSTDVRNFYLTAVGTYRAHLDGGTTLKDAVRAATTISEVESVVDPR